MKNKKRTQFKKIEVKKYPFLTILNSTRCDLKISKEKELRLKQIRKEIMKLYKEMEDLFKK